MEGAVGGEGEERERERLPSPYSLAAAVWARSQLAETIILSSSSTTGVGSQRSTCSRESEHQIA